MIAANSYELDVAYADGKPLGKVDNFDVVEEPDYTGPSRAIMERLFEKESLAFSAFSYCEGGYEITRSYDRERNLVAITLRPSSRWHP